jgi:hypothetical protein
MIIMKYAERDERLRQAVTYNNRTYIENQIITVQTSDSLNLPGHLDTLLQPGNNSVSDKIYNI